jgi:hypothetical protein
MAAPLLVAGSHFVDTACLSGIHGRRGGSRAEELLLLRGVLWCEDGVRVVGQFPCHHRWWLLDCLGACGAGRQPCIRNKYDILLPPVA